MSNNEPLWKVMHKACWSEAGFPVDAPPPIASVAECHGYAAVIQSTAEWIALKQREKHGHIPPSVSAVLGWLYDEAIRAEAGE